MAQNHKDIALGGVLDNAQAEQLLASNRSFAELKSNLQAETVLEATLVNRLTYIQRGGRVQRMHMVPTLHSQNVAAHSFGVAWWVWLLTDGKPSVNLLMAALAHDLPEGKTGDIPAPTKRALNCQTELLRLETEADRAGGIPHFETSDSEARLLKLADSLELMQHCIRERKLGNRTDELLEMFVNVSAYAAENLCTPIGERAFKILYFQWKGANQ